MSWTRYSDVIRQMERNGDYSSAREYEDSLREHGISESDRVDRFNPADGVQYSHAGDMAERAYHDIERQERYEEERREEEREQERRYHEECQRQAEQQQEEEYYYSQEQQISL